MTAPSFDGPTSISSHTSTSRMPERIRPMFASSADEPFDSPDHIFELMWGGVRVMAHIRDARVRLFGANGRDLAPFFPELATIPEMIKAREAILDGEIVATDAEGHPAFELLRPRLHAMIDATGAPPAELLKPKRIAGQLSFQAFDIPWLDGRSLAERPLWQRKNRLHEVIRPCAEFCAVDFVDDEGVAFFDAVRERKLEGVVAKQKVSQYTPGRRSTAWREVRAMQSGDFIVGGYTLGSARRKGEPFGELLLGAYESGRLDYIGAVAGGLSDAEARDVIARLEPHLAEEPSFFDPPPLPRLIHWTRPAVVCRVRFSEWGRDGHLRFPIFSALRPDLDPEDCVID